MIFDAIIWDVDPILIHFGDGGIRWYGLLWAIGLYICWQVNERMYKRENCPAEWPDQMFFWMAAGVIIGARLGHCWFYEWHDVTNPAMAGYCEYMRITGQKIRRSGVCGKPFEKGHKFDPEVEERRVAAIRARSDDERRRILRGVSRRTGWRMVDYATGKKV